MRQLARLESESSANTLAAYLVTQRIDAFAEADKEGFVIWVRDEDQLARARTILEEFRKSPADPRYHGAERTAEAVRREEERQRREKQANVVEMRGRWGSGMGIRRRCPLVIAMIAISILVAILSNVGAKPETDPLLRRLLFVDPALFDRPSAEPPHIWSSLASGQVWRFMTPMFIHYGIPHIVFNMIWLFVLGGQVEDRRGTLRFAALVLFLAVASNVGQAIQAQLQLSGYLFGGMSGVGYGVFGYVWMKAKFDNTAGYTLSKENAFIFIAWFVACILRDFPPFDSFLSGIMPHRVANTAHAVGLFLGMAIGYAPVLLKQRGK